MKSCRQLLYNTRSFKEPDKHEAAKTKKENNSRAELAKVLIRKLSICKPLIGYALLVKTAYALKTNTPLAIVIYHLLTFDQDSSKILTNWQPGIVNKDVLGDWQDHQDRTEQEMDQGLAFFQLLLLEQEFLWGFLLYWHLKRLGTSFGRNWLSTLWTSCNEEERTWRRKRPKRGSVRVCSEDTAYRTSSFFLYVIMLCD